LRHDVVETNGKALVSYLRSIPGRKHLFANSRWLMPEILDGALAGRAARSGRRLDLA
jgi:hypothetical protein